MKNMLFRNIVHIASDIDNHEIFYHALRDVSITSRYYAFTHARDAFKTLVSKKLKADFIFLDMDLPGMTSRVFLTEIQKKEDLRNIPVFILSSSVDRNIIRFTKILGARAFISKPYNRTLLKEILSSAMFFSFSTGSELISPMLNVNKRYGGGESVPPEEIYSKAVVQYGINLN